MLAPSPVADSLMAEAVANILARKRRMAEVPTDDESLWRLTRDVLGVTLPRVACCDAHTAPFQAFADAYWARHPVTVWKGSRGFAGKSKTLATLGLAEGTWLGAEVLVLGGSADQSEKVIRYIDDMVGRASFPSWLLDSQGRQQHGVTKARVRLANDGQVLAVAASTKATRGPHMPRLLVDEADELAVRVLDAALGTTMRQNGVEAQTVISSTHHYEAGTMSEVLDRAAANGWPVYEFCYRCTMRTPENPTGWLDPLEVERKRNEMPARMWTVEVELSMPSGSEGVIPREWVHAAQERWRERDKAGTLRTGPFVMAGDVSGGGGASADRAPFAMRFGNTIAELLDLTPKRKDEYGPMADRVAAECAKHSGVAVIDALGVGSALPTLLRERKVKVLAYKGSAKTHMRDRYGQFGFANYRSAAYWNMRELLDPEHGANVALPPSRELERQLCAPSWETRAGAVVAVEEKGEVVKRLGRSPDDADAVVMAFWADRMVLTGKLVA